MDTLELLRPDDWHLHLRDGPVLAAVLPATARVFGRAVVMPNLRPPVVTTAQAQAYRSRIMDALPTGLSFQPLMALYLTDDTDPADVIRGHAQGHVFGVKYYPANATTNSAAGISSIERVYPHFEAFEEAGVPVLFHGEVTSPEVDVFDREALFVEQMLAPVRRRFPQLKMVLEHVTTREGVAFVRDADIGGTLTCHHLMHDRNAMFRGGIRPHLYCLPILKARPHTEALREAATSGDPRFFLGTDSAPHARHTKESPCGCAGVFNAPVALSAYAEVFEEEGAMDRLEDFASRNGPAFYGLPANTDRIRLVRTPRRPDSSVGVGDDDIVVFEGEREFAWWPQSLAGGAS